MSTVWRGLCLDHSPAIEFDLFVENRETMSPESAITELRKGEGFHAHCDVVAGGYSYPLVSVACPHLSERSPCAGTGHPPASVFSVHTWPIGILRLVYQASRIPADTATEPLQTALAEWFRTNRCWTADRLSRLLETDR